MTTISDFHPTIHSAILFLSGQRSLQDLADREKVTKQAIHKRIQPAIEHMKAFLCPTDTVPKSELESAEQQIQRLSSLNQHLRRELVINCVKMQLLDFFKSQVLKCFPTFRVPPLPATEKKYILDQLAKFKAAGGFVREFAKRIQKSTETLSRWQRAFEKHGISGLVPKRKRPKNFGNKLPPWVKEHLLLLFLQFPRWTPYQYHCYIRHNPIIHWYVSIPTIRKFKYTYQQRTKEEKERIKKRWCFDPTISVWTVDFTCLLKTECFKLQLLTVSDQRSRFLFTSGLFLSTSTKCVINHFEELFLKYGKPFMIKADNGQEFRTDCRESLNRLSVYLLNSPEYYAQFNGAHERIHRTMKTFIDDFCDHGDLLKLANQLRTFDEQYNYSMPLDVLNGKTPADIYFNDKNFIPQDTEVISPYQKDGELRMKFKGRDNNPVRISLPLIMGLLNKVAR